MDWREGGTPANAIAVGDRPANALAIGDKPKLQKNKLII